MSFLNRIQEIITANINDLLDKVENPEMTINQMIRNMEKGISDMRKHTAAIIASQKMNEKRLTKARSEEVSWLKNAEMAVSENKEDLAKKALQKKKTASDNAEMIEMQLEEEISLVQQMKSELVVLEDKIQEARAKRDTLLARKQATLTRQRSAENTRKWSETAEKVINGFHKFDLYEDEKSNLDAHRDVKSELQEEELKARFQKKKEEKDLEEELAQLKKTLKK